MKFFLFIIIIFFSTRPPPGLLPVLGPLGIIISTRCSKCRMSFIGLFLLKTVSLQFSFSVKFVVQKMSCLQSSHLVKLLTFSVFFIRSSYKVEFGHLFFGHLNSPLVYRY